MHTDVFTHLEHFIGSVAIATLFFVFFRSNRIDQLASLVMAACFTFSIAIVVDLLLDESNICLLIDFLGSMILLSVTLTKERT